MSIAKVIEVIAEGTTIEEAFENAAEEASTSVNNIKEIWVDDIHAKVENGNISKYRIDAKVTFVVDKERQKQKT